MLCPACGDVEMFVLEFERVEVDYCYACGGVWLDSGELELIARRAGAMETKLLRALDSKPEAGGGRKSSRRCPVCRKGLSEVAAESDPPVRVDRCPAEHGLWFDRGELATLVRAAGAEQNNILARFFTGLGPREPETSED